MTEEQKTWILKIRKRFWLLIISLLFAGNVYSQTSISGVINDYAKVTNVNATKDELTLSSTSILNDGDTVLIIQMKGASLKTDTTNNSQIFGKVSFINAAGKYEVIIVDQVVDATTVKLRVPLLNTYDVNQFVQLVRVPSIKRAKVTDVLTCQTWDNESGTGGVLSLIVHDTIYLDSNIDVTGKGFRGGLPIDGEGICASVDSAKNEAYYFDETYTEAGRKGESIAKDDGTYANGRGAWATGGGGGNARFSGGGGGSNAGQGGVGGNEDTTVCEKVNYDHSLGGVQGYPLNAGVKFFNDSTVFMGGGGGSGTYNSDENRIAYEGFRGGGIIVLIAENIVSNGGSIIADGGTSDIVATAGGSGGGGGGSIVLGSSGLFENFTLSVRGGDGGWTGPHEDSIGGPGGGGGGGVILISRSSIPSNVKLELSGGEAGQLKYFTLGNNTYDAISGDGGWFDPNIILPLRGFLFNYIVDDHEVCYQEKPDTLVGSQPKGGTGSYVYEWLFSPDTLKTWSPAPGTNNQSDYFPENIETESVGNYYYRRIVTSGTITDSSNVIMISVQPTIIGNSIWDHDTICATDVADSLQGTWITEGGRGPGTYRYYWKSSLNDAIWNLEPSDNDTIFKPGALVETTFYHRVVISGGCIDTSNTLEIAVHPLIQNNTLDILYDTICNGQESYVIDGETPIYGDGNYSYSWEVSSDGSSFTTITDSTSKDYAPGTLSEDVYYRRFVESGKCSDYSNTIRIEVLDLLDNNIIDNDPLIYTCYGTEPELLDARIPTGGDNFYQYEWYSSEDQSNWDPVLISNSEDYQAEPLVNQTYFKRIVRSGEADCCVDTSNTIQVNIHPLPVAQIDSIEAATCSGINYGIQFNVTSGTSPYDIYYSDGSDQRLINNIDTSGDLTDSVNITTEEENVVLQFQIDSVIDSNGCLATDITGATELTVYGWPEAIAGTSDTIEVCELHTELEATPSYGVGLWTVLDSAGDYEFSDINHPNSSLDSVNAGYYQLEWRETNWTCTDADTITYQFYEPLDSVFILGDSYRLDDDTIYFYFQKEATIYGRFDDPDRQTTVVSAWDHVGARAPEILATQKDSTTIASGENIYGEPFHKEIDVNWTLSKGVCDLKQDNIKVIFRDIDPPEGFSPDGDDVNDTFVIRGEDNITEGYDLYIYNRWGVEVYHQDENSIIDEWDGKNQNGKDLPDGTYFYVLTIKYDGNKEKPTLRGFVTLKRRK